MRMKQKNVNRLSYTMVNLRKTGGRESLFGLEEVAKTFQIQVRGKEVGIGNVKLTILHRAN